MIFLIFDYPTFFSAFSSFSVGLGRINFIYRSLRPVIINSTKLNYSVLSGKNQWNHYGNLRYKQRLLENQLQRFQFPQNTRSYGMLVGRILRGALKIRYLLLGGAVGGTVTLNKVQFCEIVLFIGSLNWNCQFSIVFLEI